MRWSLGFFIFSETSMSHFPKWLESRYLLFLDETFILIELSAAGILPSSFIFTFDESCYWSIRLSMIQPIDIRLSLYFPSSLPQAATTSFLNDDLVQSRSLRGPHTNSETICLCSKIWGPSVFFKVQVCQERGTLDCQDSFEKLIQFCCHACPRIFQVLRGWEWQLTCLCVTATALKLD